MGQKHLGYSRWITFVRTWLWKLHPFWSYLISEQALIKSWYVYDKMICLWITCKCWRLEAVFKLILLLLRQFQLVSCKDLEVGLFGAFSHSLSSVYILKLKLWQCFFMNVNPHLLVDSQYSIITDQIKIIFILSYDQHRQLEKT